MTNPESGGPLNEEPIEKGGVMRLAHHQDPLKNLSYMRGECHSCNTELRDTITEELQSGWAVCSCGAVIPVKNVTKWH